MKIDAVNANANAVLKSLNAVLSIFFFASHWDTFRYGNIHKNDSELLSSNTMYVIMCIFTYVIMCVFTYTCSQKHNK